MNEEEIKEYILENFDGVESAEDEGNLFFFYDRENRLPFASIVVNNKYDKYSDLDRESVFRLNIATGKSTYRSMFQDEDIPAEAGYDFTALDVVMPHPEYGRVYWICVLNPSKKTFGSLEPMLAEAYQRAVKKFETFAAARHAKG